MKSKKWCTRLFIASIFAAQITHPQSSSADSHEWTRQLGSFEEDASLGVSADRLGNVFIAGYTSGNLMGSPSGGVDTDAFISKYDAAGVLHLDEAT